MKVEQYIASLAPSMRKDKILDDLAVVRKELRDATIPAYETILTLMGKWTWRSPEMKAMSANFSRIVGGKGVRIPVDVRAPLCELPARVRNARHGWLGHEAA